MEVCMELVELGADLNKAGWVSEICCNCISVCRCIIVQVTLYFFELGWMVGLDVGCV